MKLADAFDTFHDAIVLGQEQTERIDSASQYLAQYLHNHYSVAKDQVFLQGSYPNGTAVKPDPERDGGEYDVDLVSISAQPEATPEQALDELETTLAASGDFKERIDRDPERPCVRLRYADDDVGGFHVDVTPARPATSGQAPLEIPRPGHGWHDTAPSEYTQWCRDRGPAFARTVQMFKRWRDHNQSARKAIKSIVLQVLIAQELVDDQSDGVRLAGTLTNIENFLGGYEQPPETKNPVLDSENLTERWEDDDYRDFKQTVADAAALAREALGAGDPDRSHELWRKLLGKDFPPAPKRGTLPPPPRPAPGTRTTPQEAPSRVEWA
jgi:hypothetical protein